VTLYRESGQVPFTAHRHRPRNIRRLIEWAAANSGAEDESRNADRLAAQWEELDRLTKERVRC
jgi:hypothetical protein